MVRTYHNPKTTKIQRSSNVSSSTTYNDKTHDLLEDSVGKLEPSCSCSPCAIDTDCVTAAMSMAPVAN